jgi:hypothetical protein
LFVNCLGGYQASGLNHLINAIVYWNMLYLEPAYAEVRLAVSAARLLLQRVLAVSRRRDSGALDRGQQALLLRTARGDRRIGGSRGLDDVVVAGAEFNMHAVDRGLPVRFGLAERGRVGGECGGAGGESAEELHGLPHGQDLRTSGNGPHTLAVVRPRRDADLFERVDEEHVRDAAGSRQTSS